MSPEPEHPGVTEGRFDSPEQTVNAVEQLVDFAAIPSEEIDVYAVDRSGNRGRKIRVLEDPGIKRGARVGAIAGACLGLLAFIIVGLTGHYGPADAGYLSLLHAGYYIGASAAAGIPLGAALGLAGWFGGRRLDTRGARANAFVVVVRTHSQADEAREVLRSAGATNVA